MKNLSCVLLTTALIAAAGCGELTRTVGDDGSTAQQGLLGEACFNDGSCSEDLICRADTCETACPNGDSLTGSIGEVFSLDFDFVQALKQGTALRIEYIDDVAGGSNKVCKLVIDTAALTLGDGSIIDSELFGDVTVVERVAATTGDFPPVYLGEIRFGIFEFVGGERICGEFDVEFMDAVGRTLSGSFDTIVSEIPL